LRPSRRKLVHMSRDYASDSQPRTGRIRDRGRRTGRRSQSFIRRRFHLIPFAVTIPPEERDKDLAEKLKAEWPAILRWMVDGCLIWQRDGLNPPQAVIDATNQYLETEDSIGTWIAESCELKASYQDTSAALYVSWKAWAELNGEHVGSQKTFSEKLQSRGIEKITIGHAKAAGCRGIRVVVGTETQQPFGRRSTYEWPRCGCVRVLFSNDPSRARGREEI